MLRSRSVVIGFAAAIVLVLGSGRAVAATPERVIVTRVDGRARVTITNPHDLVALVGSLCSGQKAGGLAGRPAMRIEVRWTDDLAWTGRLYPAAGGAPMAVDVPAWTLYGSTAAEPQGCRDRTVGGPALAALRRNRVPVAQGDPFPRHGAPTWLLLVAIAAVALGATALLATRLRRRRTGSVRP